MTIHELKTWPYYFRSVTEGSKTFEVRLNDRGFDVGDKLRLREWDPVDRQYSGNSVFVEISYLMHLRKFADMKGFRWSIARHLMPNIVIIGLKKTQESKSGGINHG